MGVPESDYTLYRYPQNGGDILYIAIYTEKKGACNPAPESMAFFRYLPSLAKKPLSFAGGISGERNANEQLNTR